MHRSALIAAICMSLPVQTAVCQEAFQVANITIKMIKRDGRGNFRIDAEITNPNDFAVFDVRVACKIRDRRGKELVSYGSTVVDAIQAKEVRTVRRLDIGAWPDQGRAAYCRSSEAKRLPNR
jgi:hypothetical protein